MFSSKMQPCFQITQTRRCLVRNRWHEVAISIMLSWSRKKNPLLATPHKRIKNRLREMCIRDSSDTASHAYIYRNMPDVYGVVHTHSTYATAWAATGQNIPCGLTMMGDEFGGPVPVGPFRLIGSEAIGEGVVETLKKYPKSPAVLMQNHGPFTIGKDAEGAVKAAAMTAEVAHTMWAARQLGDIIEIDQADIDKLNDRYQNVYGQH